MMRALCISATFLTASAVAIGCGERTLPPLGEVVVVVDTDLAVPRVASRLRVDTYALDGTWLESRDVARPDPRDWPASFSVQAADDVVDREIVVRLRVYGTRTSDVVGGPRLVRDGADVTPAREPLAGLAVDRLVRLTLRPGERGRVRVVAEAACAGDPARLAPRSFETCIGGTRIALSEPSPTEPELATPTESVVGAAARSPCTAAARRDDVACIEGGTFVLGADDVTVVPDPSLSASPERVIRVSTFAMDRHEVTVSGFRAALARGFTPPDAPGATEGPLGGAPETSCAYSAAQRDRESFAMSCVTWATARAYCSFLGGDLPSEAQWEYAATSAARSAKTLYPWGDDAPHCARAIYGRLELAGQPGSCEREAGRGPRAVLEGGAPVAPRDLAATGIHGLGGGVAEWSRDTPAPYGAPCTASSLDPVCVDPMQTAHVVRGGGWASPVLAVRSIARLASSAARSFVGFRCVYPVGP